MNILALSGWGQAHDALSSIVPQAVHFDYSVYDNVEQVMEEIVIIGREYDAVIGWSLGGQILVRALANGVIKTDKMVLIATPFSFVSNDNVGMPADQFVKFRENYSRNSPRTLTKAWGLISLDDEREVEVKEWLNIYDKSLILKKNWLYWLDELERFNCDSLDFDKLPASLIIHGVNDKVVDFAQSDEFVKRMGETKHIVMNGAGHAPHWHDSEFVKKQVEKYITEK
ncbi:MAG: alpha/beta hydrolase [Rickettsiales bacterium]